jgi:hypothetical protein
MIVVSVLLVAVFSAVWPTVIEPAVGALLPSGSCFEDRLVRSQALDVRLTEASNKQPVQIASNPLRQWSLALESHRFGN